MMTIVQYKPKTRDDFLKEPVAQLIQLRNDMGMTQEQLDYRLGVADRLVSKWECGDRSPTGFNLYCWADALNGKLLIVKNPDRPPQSPEGQMGVLTKDGVKYYTPVNNNITFKKAA